jgi:hypothetical protein
LLAEAAVFDLSMSQQGKEQGHRVQEEEEEEEQEQAILLALGASKRLVCLTGVARIPTPTITPPS